MPQAVGRSLSPPPLFGDNKTAYMLLGVPQEAGPDVIEKAFKIQARAFPPGRNRHSDSTRRFQEIVAARDLLCNQRKRMRYDLKLARLSDPESKPFDTTRTNALRKRDLYSTRETGHDYNLNNQYCDLVGLSNKCANQQPALQNNVVFRREKQLRTITEYVEHRVEITNYHVRQVVIGKDTIRDPASGKPVTRYAYGPKRVKDIQTEVRIVPVIRKFYIDVEVPYAVEPY